jgi:mRNA interferase RelE/StbE
VIAYVFTTHADRQLRKLPEAEQRRLILKVKHYLASPNPLQYATKMEGARGPTYRFRIDPYRVIFDWLGESILVLKVGHRRDVYR